MTFHFFWNGMPDRLKRCNVTLPHLKGGLNLPDLETFWASLKLTWARRLMYPNCLWQKILSLNLMYVNHNMGDIWFGGPTRLHAVAEKLSNLFWKEIIHTFAVFA